jgi:uncharacterized protein (DUF1684 family)
MLNCINFNKYLIAVISILLIACTTKSSYTNQVEIEQKRRQAVFIDPEQSPLDTAEIRLFNGLKFFAPDEAFKVNATITWLPQIVYLKMPQTSGASEDYMQTAVLDFTLNDQAFQLPVYQNEEMKRNRTLFVPFSDKTNGKETYNGGRYIDLPYNDHRNDVVLDFNYAYIPYCAHTPRYACPVVPKENNIDIAITVGERL